MNQTSSRKDCKVPGQMARISQPGGCACCVFIATSSPTIASSILAYPLVPRFIASSRTTSVSWKPVALPSKRPMDWAFISIGQYYTPMDQALKVLDDTISRFRNTPIYVTEASNNKSGTTASAKAHQYLAFWKELQQRPIVEGVTYFVASASNPDFKEEVFLGRGMSRIIGAR